MPHLHLPATVGDIWGEGGLAISAPTALNLHLCDPLASPVVWGGGHAFTKPCFNQTCPGHLDSRGWGRLPCAGRHLTARSMPLKCPDGLGGGGRGFFRGILGGLIKNSSKT